MLTILPGPSGATTLTGSSVVDGTGQIALANLHCIGREYALVDCSHRGFSMQHNCEDAGVRCLLPPGKA